MQGHCVIVHRRTACVCPAFPANIRASPLAFRRARPRVFPSNPREFSPRPPTAGPFSFLLSLSLFTPNISAYPSLSRHFPYLHGSCLLIVPYLPLSACSLLSGVLIGPRLSLHIPLNEAHLYARCSHASGPDDSRNSTRGYPTKLSLIPADRVATRRCASIILGKLCSPRTLVACRRSDDSMVRHR